MCILTGMAATAVMLVAVLGGITGGYFAAQAGTALAAKLWPSRSPMEAKKYPLAPIVALPAFCAGFYAAFILASGVARGMAC